MKIKQSLLVLLWIPALLLAACSGLPVVATLPDLPAQAAATAPVGSDNGSAAGSDNSSANGIAAGSASGYLAALEETFTEIYTSVNPSVVNIQVSRSSRTGLTLDSGLGSGFVWDTAGHIVTNAHVVSGASQISVTFADGSVAEAQLVGADPYSDLAVISVDVPASQLYPVLLADSGQVRVGQLAIAIGNPFGLQGTMTQGIISGLARSLSVDQSTALSQLGGRYSIPDIIQTDAPINPGNSGGVLVDVQGQVIGVTTAIATTTQSNSGVGFVIPAAIVQRFVPELIDTGQVRHAWMGISGLTLTPALAQAAGLPEDQRGALVLGVTSGGPASQAGIQAGGRQVTVEGQPVNLGGDVIVAIDGLPVERFEDLVSYLYNQTDPGQKVSLTLLRQGQERTVQLTLGELPE